MRTSLKGCLAVACLMLGLFTASVAQSTNNEKVTIALSQPGKPGTLQVHLLQGAIKVTGHNGKDVLVSYSLRGGNNLNTPREESEGLRRLPNNNAGLEAREENNEVTIKTSLLTRPVDLDIKVPHDFSVELKTWDGGQIVVEDINGKLDVDNLNGGIVLRNVSGSASASTLNGNIEANFRKLTPNMPMAFSNLNGKIDVTLPATAKFNVKLKTDNGDIFTDFDMAMDKGSSSNQDKSGSTNKLRNNAGEAGQRIYLDKWMHGKINGGGPELLFKNFNGNIYIRKSK